MIFKSQRSCATVPNFVPPLHQEPSHLVVVGQGSESPVLMLIINTIANHRALS
jgi:hypothetical protein